MIGEVRGLVELHKYQLLYYSVKLKIGSIAQANLVRIRVPVRSGCQSDRNISHLNVL